ncbi:MAG: hypothetical protein JWQ40_2021 [Segetibacter sp.]|nr:hypothetical protein [Segetibacter sp.]
MKGLFVAFAAVILASSCSKEKLQEIQQDLAISIMTSGDWVITKFTEGETNTTASFAGWQCHFNENKTCEATKGTNKVQGTWDASTSSKTITGMFPAGAEPLTKINGTWNIVRTTPAFGEFTQAKNGIIYTMELTKK